MKSHLRLVPDKRAALRAAGALIGPDACPDVAPGAPPTPASAFDYSVLPAGDAATLQTAAANIKSLIQKSIRDVGRELIAARAVLPHGQFSAWVQAEFGMTQRSAENYMNATRFLEGKPKHVSALPARVIYQLAAPCAPQELVQQLVAEAEAGRPLNHHDIADRLKGAADTRREAERAERQKAEKLERRRRRLQEKGVTREEAERRAAELLERQQRQLKRERETRAREWEERKQRWLPIAAAMLAALSDEDRDAVRRTLAEWGGEDRSALLEALKEGAA